MHASLAGARIPHPRVFGVAWWEFEQNDSGLTFLDSTPQLNDLTLSQSSASLSVAGGVTGRAMYRGGDGAGFAGRKIYVPMANTAFNFGPSDSFSLGAWINPQADMGVDWTRAICGRNGLETNIPPPGTSLVHTGYYLGLFAGVLSFEMVEPGAVGRSASGGAVAPNGTWQLLIGVCDVAGGFIHCYTNGALISSTAILSGPQTGGVVDANFTVSQITRADGANNVADDVEKRQFNGYVDKCFVTRKVLTAADCAFLYNGGSGRAYAEAKARGIMLG